MTMKAIVIDIYMTMIVIVIWYHDTDHDDDVDCDAEESGESKEGGYSTNPVPIDWQSHLIHWPQIIIK